MIRLVQDKTPVEELLDQHRAVLEYERFVQTHTVAEVEDRYPGDPPACSCVICQQLEEFSDKLVTVMRDIRVQDNAPESDSPRLETLMRDLAAFSEAAERHDFNGKRSARNLRSWGG